MRELRWTTFARCGDQRPTLNFHDPSHRHARPGGSGTGIYEKQRIRVYLTEIRPRTSTEGLGVPQDWMPAKGPGQAASGLTSERICAGLPALMALQAAASITVRLSPTRNSI